MNAAAGAILAPAPGQTGPAATPGSFGGFVSAAHAAGRLVVQPRMGVSSPQRMREGLAAVKAAAATTVGTVTLDSFTRVGDEAAARLALAGGGELNGYPLTTHHPSVTRQMLDGIRDRGFPVQVRHGSAAPQAIVAALIEAGLDATEGGPVSYCLPYSRRPVRESVRNWAECCAMLAGLREHGAQPHLETFGGCMLGQLCPPSLLVAISVLEALFFRSHGLRSISLSYAQQTSAQQDREAVAALHRLAAELLPDVDRHVVLYAYMGVYPRTEEGALDLLEAAARLAVDTGSARLIVKTTAEARRIPTIAENITALEAAAGAARRHRRQTAPAPDAAHTPVAVPDTGLYAEARALVEAVLDLDDDLGRGLTAAFERGYLDVPYCLHPDNAGRARSYIDGEGALRWQEVGSMPIVPDRSAAAGGRMTSATLLGSLSYVADTFDRQALGRSRTAVPSAAQPGTVPLTA